MKKILLPTAILFASGLGAVSSAHAATAGSILDVSATITSDCTVATTPVNFGNVISGSGATASGSIDVTCTLATPYAIALDNGGNYLAPNRQIADGLGNFLSYTLADNLTSLAWGDDGTTITGASVPGTGTGALQSYVVDATLIGANVPTGAYSDTVNVTVTY